MSGTAIITTPSTGEEGDPTVPVGLGSIIFDVKPIEMVPAQKLIQKMELNVDIRSIQYLFCVIYILKHSPVVCVDVLVNAGEDVGSVQTVENVPVVSNMMFEELIKRVQSPGSMGDSSLKVQLGSTFTWNTLPTVGSTAKPSTTAPSTCNQEHADNYRMG